MRRDLAVGSVTLALLLVVLAQLGFFDLQRVARGFQNFLRFSQDMVPPDLGLIPLATRALLETIQMAFAGTLLGFFVALPLGFLGAVRLFPYWVVLPVRFLVAAVRTIPSLLWALLFVIVVGLGPLAGTLALAAYTVGYLGKLFAEFFEGTDPEVLEAVRGLGASRVQLARFVLWPECANEVLSQLLFLFEYNVRASTILGFVGAGGIGFYLQVYVQTLEYQRMTTLLLLVLAMVVFMDVASAWARRNYLANAPAH